MCQGKKFIHYRRDIVLVRFTEICNNGVTSTQQTYILREVLVNPEHVIMIREEPRMQRLNEQGLLHEKLDVNHRFSKLTMNRGQTGTEIVVVGAPGIIENTLNNNSKQLLKG